jgi:N-acetyl-1-D-myo-inositol-2-amino-2-deoxy-alpha-D-glucopyranoside deacetylase
MTADTLPERRMLLVHAHPDDETIANGATMAKYVDDGVHVTLVTCTLGEEGEVLVPDLAHLAAAHEDALGKHRIGELADAMRILGVVDHRFLGGPGRYRDTGMAVDDQGRAIAPERIRDDAFWAADLLEASNHVVEVIREIRPQVMVTYDENGAYGHPDHIQAHRAATYGSALAAAPSYRRDLGEAWDVAKIYWNAMSEERMREGLRRLRDSGDTTTFEGMEPDGELPSFVTPDALITATVDGLAYVDKKLDAMRAHATQITVDGPFFALSNNIGNQVWGIESYRLIKGTAGQQGADGHETSLFAGVV